MTRSRSKLISLALVLVVVLSIGGGGTAAAQTAGNDTYSVQQDGKCVQLAPHGDGSEAVEDYYDYRSNETENKSYTYSSWGTTDIQENQTSKLLIHNGSDGMSLVLIHDKLANVDKTDTPAPYGSTITMDLTKLPAGTWAVQDDYYGNGSQDDNWDISGETASIDWMWEENRSDGGAYNGLHNMSSGDEIVIDPAFNEEAENWDTWRYAGDPDNRTEEWLARSSDGTETELNMSKNVTVERSACEGDGDDGDTEPPTAKLDASPTEATIGETISFDASNSTDNESIVDYRWDFDGDGAPEKNTTEPNTTSSYGQPGTYDATVTVVDGADNTATATVTITVKDAEPPDAKLDASPTNATTGEIIDFDASNSTDNVGIVEYKWDFDGDGAPEKNTTEPNTTASYAQADTYDANVTVVDGADNTDTATVTINVTDDGDDGDTEPPEAKLDASPTEATIDETISFDASNSTDNESIVEYNWDFDGDGAPEKTTKSSATTTASYGQAGTYDAEVTVADAAGNTDSATVTITVTEDEEDDGDTERPTAKLDVQDRTTAGSTINLDASGSSDNVEIVKYHWDFDGDGDVDKTTDSPNVYRKYETKGEFEPTVTVEDAAGNTDSAAATLTVESADTEPPTAELHVLDETTTGTKITLDASGSTDNREIYEYLWDFEGDGEIDRRTTSPTVHKRYDTAGEYEPTLYVKDLARNSDSATETLKIKAGEKDTEPPTATLHVPDEVTVDEEFTVKATDVSDPSGISHICWYYDGEVGPDGKTMTLSFDETGEHTVSLRIVDDLGNEQTITRTISVVAADHSDDSSDSDDSDDSDDSNDTDDSNDSNDSDDHDDDDHNDDSDDNDDSPNISVNSVQISDESITAGDDVEFTATVENTGDAEGTHNLSLLVTGPDGNNVSNSTEMSVPAGENRTANMTMSFDEPGEYTAQMGNQSFNITVNDVETDESTETPTEAPTDTPSETPSDGNSGEQGTDSEVDKDASSESGPGFGFVTVLVATILGVLALHRRR